MMENTLQFKDTSQVSYIFDLKGSTVNREVKGIVKNSTVLKDMNFRKVAKALNGLTMMKADQGRKINQILSKDVNFLKKHNLMDFSLLLGIEKKTRP